MRLRWIVLTGLLAACTSVPDLEGAAPTDFFLRDQHEQVWDSTKLSDKTLLIDFWATWCKPCLANIPELNAFHRKYGEKVLLLGVAADNKGWEAVKPAIAKHGIQYAVAVAHPNLAKAYGLRGYPYLVVLHQGKIVKQMLGRHRLKDLEKALKKYLE